jgi:hypothetical protein
VNGATAAEIAVVTVAEIAADAKSVVTNPRAK